MKPEERKAAVAAYKDRKVFAGAYLVSCAATGQRWAGSAPDLATIWNRLSFTLRQDINTHRSLQAAWREHGADSFTFEIVERIEVESFDDGGARALKHRLQHWCKALKAEPI